MGGASTALIVIKALGVDLEVAEAQEASSTPVPSAAKSPLSVAADDPAIAGGDFTYESGGVTYTAYEAKPTGSATPEAGVGKGGLILVCHENRGLTEHIRDVTRRSQGGISGGGGRSGQSRGWHGRIGSVGYPGHFDGR